MKKNKISHKERFISLSAYVFGPAPFISQFVCLLILLTRKRNKYIRFHVLQSFIFFSIVQISVILLAYTLIGLIIIPFILIAEFILWLLFLWRTFHGEQFSIPIIGSFIKVQFLQK